ncbi:hypothetical protein AN1920.2 [Aspergillus nidulans FGSC A4]|uniref:Sodium ion/proton exchanger (Eurofung) n=1 Tax=Emericella nidulans (strain FGSC A4 / ATCC 38163 / CBS 112.46 / NRRL 194 / M139) TaxID=227321 RepID=Q5BC10_EMENI|nr:hypothetical protein [Aspergillus nidulans FGSC A4]EAA65085.1 hypothetical protein AN1920.2 [Aspergillus nidulans FGSC A4]CBF85828.1 TPA: sodium ion/proton exchanger (Eurofung) [Aspergillus nidulans FGSC A4]|eukprot:XP_659524.1 hypothetical protein AN1920.2 [Aspergillus nidulans FGSC A4]
MLHPILETSALNVILVVTCLYVLIIGFISLKVKQRWYLGEALPAFAVGAAFGPSAANLLRVPHYRSNESESTTSEVTYALARLVIGIQLVKAGYELPKRYLKRRLKEMTLCLLPLMAIGWVASSACIKLMVPHISFLAALIIGSCVTCTDPILSQAIAKGPFTDNYVRRHLREFISSEAGGNDGFGFSFLLLGLALLRYADTPANAAVLEEFDLTRGGADLLGATDVGRFGGGAGEALKHWWRLWDYCWLHVPKGPYFFIQEVVALPLVVKVHGSVLILEQEVDRLRQLYTGSCVAGSVHCNMLNWDGMYNAELQTRHDSFNSSLETILNHITFGYLGLGMMILVFRRIPAIMAGYRFMPEICSNWKEALFMGHFGPIGVGAIAYVEYARRLFPDPGESDEEINSLTAAMRPVHGLSVPILYVIYKASRVPKVHDHPVEVVLLSKNEPLPNNSTVDRQRHSVLVNNQFAEPTHPSVLNDDSDDEKESSYLQESCERIRPRSERSSMSYISETPIPQEASQRLNHEVNPRNLV